MGKIEQTWPGEFRILVEQVTAIWECTTERILSKDRRRDITEPRYVIMYLARVRLDYTLERIRILLGYKDHGCVTEAERLVPLRITQNSKLRQRVLRVEQICWPETTDEACYDAPEKRRSKREELDALILPLEKQRRLLRRALRELNRMLEQLRVRRERLAEPKRPT